MLEIAIGIIGLILAWLTYKKTFYSKPIEEKNHLLVQFKATQTLSLQLTKSLTLLAEKNDWFDDEIFPNVTYREYISQMKISYDTNLSDDLLNRIKKEDLSKSNILSLTKSLEEQFNALMLIKTETDMKLMK